MFNQPSNLKLRLSQVLFVIIFSSLVFSCKNKEKTATQDSMTYCYVPSDSLIGRGDLDAKMIAGIEAIKPNKDLLTDTHDMVLIKGGVFQMGGDVPEGSGNMPNTALPQNDEFPKHPVQVSDFFMDEHEVTVAEFAEFVKATGYKTTAEYDIDWEELKKQVPPGTPKPADEMLKAGALVFHYVPEGTDKDNLANWWEFKAGINWRNPDGTHPDLEKIANYPVTQVSWYDAMAYAKWANKRLPTEAEYEYAMRAGRQNTMYPWGNESVAINQHHGNFLQGSFPYNNTAVDGYEGLAPVKSFPKNGYGLYDISGNVWEWTMDWYGANYYETLNQKQTTAVNPKGPDKTLEVYMQEATNKVVRGGSFLCNDDWCSGFRNARRMRLSPDSGMQHVGFRCVRDVR